MNLPEEILTKIYMMYYKQNVIECIECKEKIIGFGETSKELKNLLENDVGAYQEGYSEIEEMMEDDKLLKYKNDGMCILCKEGRIFPCIDCNNKYFDGEMKIKLMF
jgi:hypothetical protein